MTETRGAIPAWVKVAYTAMVAVIVPVYWVEYGPTNFLWFSDVALLAMVPALWLENRLLASMMAVGVLPLELAWMAGFFSGGALLEIADYMFEEDRPLWLRALSLYHFPMPAAILLSLRRLGYDPRALPAQAVVLLVLVPVTHVLTEPHDNVNWAHGPGGPQEAVPGPVYVAGLVAVLFVAVYLPAHAILKIAFPARERPR